MKHTILVMGLMWGDEGKGSVVHALAKATGCDLIVRFNGGANAGHTVELDDGQRLAYQQLPSGSGIKGVRSVIANGSVVNFHKLLIEHWGKDANIMISTDAHVVTQEHINRDKSHEFNRDARDKIGVTNSGNGPVYSDKMSRFGMTVGQLVSGDRIPEEYQEAFDDLNASRVQLINSQEYLREVQAHDDGVMILEGAHGWELDIDHGDYPFVTSSSCGIGGAAIGTGLDPRSIDEVIGVVKAYSTRVGPGAFPNIMSLEDELLLRENHSEVGTNTKRRRRVDWMNIVRVKKACEANGVDRIALTHLDVLSGFQQVHISKEAGICWSLPGWPENIQNCREFEELPPEAQAYVKLIENLTGVYVSLISVGPKESQLIWRADEE